MEELSNFECFKEKLCTQNVTKQSAKQAVSLYCSMKWLLQTRKKDEQYQNECFTCGNNTFLKAEK
jgi:hypothetical protein